MGVVCGERVGGIDEWGSLVGRERHIDVGLHACQRGSLWLYCTGLHISLIPMG